MTSVSFIDFSLIASGPVKECRIPTRIGFSTRQSRCTPYQDPKLSTMSVPSLRTQRHLAVPPDPRPDGVAPKRVILESIGTIQDCTRHR